jgi:exonuclease SbcD
MKLMHLSDLHIGKRVNEYSMIEDQIYILDEILKIVSAEEPNGIIIAGDVYDKAVPTAEAVGLLDGFLTALADKNIPVFIISGNHDSPERMAFGSKLMEKSGIFISKVYDGNVEPYRLSDEFGDVNIYLLPFVKPAHVRRFYEDDILSYTDALRIATEKMGVNANERNVLVTHQFVTGAERSESEELSVGGTDNVDASVFSDFDYVALGHIHKPQSMDGDRIRYSGSPLKYSFSEAKDNKSVTVVELYEKGRREVRTVPLTPLREMVEIKGKYADITLKSFYENTTYMSDYIHVTLTDEEDVVDAVGKLRAIYRNLMKLDYDNARTRSATEINGAVEAETKTPLELFSEFYLLQNNSPMSDEQSAFVSALIEKIWEADE